MSDDIKDRLGQELQGELENLPTLSPAQFVDGPELVTVTISEGIPQVHISELPGIKDHSLPHVSELVNSEKEEWRGLYKIYNLLRALELISQDDNAVSATEILNQTPPPLPRGVETIPVGPPPSHEMVASTVTERTSLVQGPDDEGMHQNLRATKERLAALVKENPILPAFVIRTAKGSYQIQTAAGALEITPSGTEGTPYIKVSTTPYGKIFLLHKTISGLETKLFGSPLNQMRKVARSPILTTRDHLQRHLSEYQGGEISVQIKRTKQTLYLSEANRAIVYRDILWALNEEGLLQERKLEARFVGGARFVKLEFGAAPANVRRVIEAFFSFLSVQRREEKAAQ